jgi:hypothetical protein
MDVQNAGIDSLDIAREPVCEACMEGRIYPFPSHPGGIEER